MGGGLSSLEGQSPLVERILYAGGLSSMEGQSPLIKHNLWAGACLYLEGQSPAHRTQAMGEGLSSLEGQSPADKMHSMCGGLTSTTRLLHYIYSKQRQLLTFTWDKIATVYMNDDNRLQIPEITKPFSSTQPCSENYAGLCSGKVWATGTAPTWPV